jgi:hypothetical protein
MRWLLAPDAGRRMTESWTLAPLAGCDQSRGTAIVAHWNAPGVQGRQASAGGGGAGAAPDGVELADGEDAGPTGLAGGDAESLAVAVAVDGTDGDGVASCLRPVQAAARRPVATSR